ncbi:MAG: hypothetical protein NT123_24980 [Proteobacteria bacterium]|nr:hypothetical protein [Pseudomonadota bacterium]
MLWLLSPLVSFVAGRYSEYPNQIYYIYKLFLVIAAALVFRDFVKITIVQLKWQLFVIAYAVALIAASYFGVSFETSVSEYLVLYQPLSMFDFFVAFVAGYKFHERKLFSYFYSIGVILFVYSVIDMLANPDKSRYITSLDLPMVIPVAIILGKTLFAIILVAIAFASIKKTIVFIAVLSFGLSWWYKYRNSKIISRDFATGDNHGTWHSVLARMAVVVCVLALFIVIASNFQSTIDRLLLTDEEDTVRSLIQLTSFQLLSEYFPRGIGFGGFSFITRDDIPYPLLDQRGNLTQGANLHNSFMTWALEGGLPVLLVVCAMFFAMYRTIRSFWRHKETTILAFVLSVWLLQGVIFGLVQQWHSASTFWMLFGYAFGCRERYRGKL